MDVTPLLMLVAGSAAVAGAARRTRAPAPLLLVAAGLVVSYLPGAPDYTLDPDVVLPLVLPPLLHTAALDSSYLDLRANLRPVALLSFGYVLFATLAVGWIAHLLVPGLPLTAALVLGAVIAPPDAVAATAIARRVGLPSRLTTVLRGESLVNDATAITAYRVALAAAVGEGATWTHAAGEFLLAAGGGVGVGLVLMVPLHWLRTRLRDPLLQNTLSLLIPFTAYAAAEQVEASGVLAVVVVALYLGHRSWQVDFATRLQEAAVWKMIAFILESAVFALIGLQLRFVVGGLGEYGAGEAAWYAAALLLQPVTDPVAQPRHREPARVHLSGLPLQVPDHRPRRPAVVAADRRADLLDRLQLGLGPGVLAVAEVLALEAVEVPVAVGVGLVVVRQRLLGDHRAQDVVVAEARVVGAAVADQVEVAVLGDDAVAERAGQVRAAVAAQGHRLRAALGDRVVDHHAVDGSPRALVVAVVVLPVADLDDLDALRLQTGQETARGHG
jgi:NhaP-type Na+/H+ or K+/H+ antiporter